MDLGYTVSYAYASGKRTIFFLTGEDLICMTHNLLKLLMCHALFENVRY